MELTNPIVLVSSISLFNVFSVVQRIYFVVLLDVFYLQYGEKSSVYRGSSQETNKSHCSVSTKIYLIVFGRRNSFNRMAGL